MPHNDLSPESRERFDRNLRIPEIGCEGQKRLLGASALVVGAGGLGSAAILYLASAGVGRLAIADSGRLELSNLNRQVLHRTCDVGRRKVDSAREAVFSLCPICKVEIVADRLDAGNVRGMVRGFDVVLDCSDNFPTRLGLSDAAWQEKIPLVSAAAVRMEGRLLTVLPGRDPCYRCLVPELPPEAQVPRAVEVGILGGAAGAMGALQAVEAVKVLLGVGETLIDRLLIYDGLGGRFREVKRVRDPACPLCGKAVM
jgi:adenylyltransferase/sulfurtransferase